MNSWFFFSVSLVMIIICLSYSVNVLDYTAFSNVKSPMFSRDTPHQITCIILFDIAGFN